MRNAQVALAWSEGRKGRSSNGNYWTTGKRLYSRSMLIGFTGENGKKYLLDATGRNSPSISTTRHVSHAYHHANEIVQPKPHSNPYCIAYAHRHFPDEYLAKEEGNDND